MSACAPRIASQGIENVKPAIAQDTFQTRDGMQLALRHWDAPSPIAIIVALHGMSDYSNAFDMPATFWAQNGITTYAYDQRGFGKSPNPGVWAGADALRGDLTISSMPRVQSTRTCRFMRSAKAWGARSC